jgi:hypothetical protein
LCHLGDESVKRLLTLNYDGHSLEYNFEDVIWIQS